MLPEKSPGNEAGAFESSAPSRSRVNLRHTGEMSALFETSIYMAFLCKCVHERVRECVRLCGPETLTTLFSVWKCDEAQLSSVASTRQMLYVAATIIQCLIIGH